MRSTEEVFDSESMKSAPLPDDAESDSPSSTSEQAPAAKGETPAPAEAKTAPKTAETAGDDEDEGSLPADLEGYKKALAAARGDKRKARAKWQEAEQKLARFEGQLTAMQNMQRQQPAPAEQPKQDAKGLWDHDDPSKYIEEKIQERQQELREQFTKQLIDVERRAMRRAHTDYADAEKAFVEAAQASPQLAAAIRSMPPADAVEFAYKEGKSLLLRQKYGASSIDDLAAKIRAEVTAELQGQTATETTPTTAAKAPIPPKSNASARGVGVGTTQQWSGPRSTQEIFG